VVFKSSTGEVAICEHCRSVVVRKDANVEAIGEMAVLPPDETPLQVGSHGSINGLGFTLLGRLRIQWSGGSWNEWFVEYGDQSRGWVGEAQGFFMVLRETPLTTAPPIGDLGAVTAGQQIPLNGGLYKVTDAKPVQCVGGEGELPEPVKAGEPWESVDLERTDGFVATLEQGPGGLRLFEGRAATFEELAWQNLRALPGWNGVPMDTQHHATLAQTCPSCGGVIGLRAAGLTMTAVCTHCGSVLDTSTPQLQVVQKAAAKRTCQPAIPLGQRGNIQGADWEMIGFMQRRDSGASWLEYLLYNPFHGFRWLTEYEGRWTWMDRLLVTPNLPASQFDDEEEDSSVTYVEGEFYWQVRRGERSLVSEAQRGSTLISRERYPGLNEITYSSGYYVDGRDVRRAFNIAGPTAPTDLNPIAEKWRTLRPVMLLFLALLVITHLVSATMGKGGKPFEMSGNFNRLSQKGNLLVSEPFEVPHQGAVDITAGAPVNNSWIGLDLQLINQKTGEAFDGYISVEYYHGEDSDGPWSEGGRTASTSIPAVPPGVYTLVVSMEADAPIMTMPYTVKVNSGGTYLSNLFLAGFILLLWPLITLYRRHRYTVNHRMQQL